MTISLKLQKLINKSFSGCKVRKISEITFPIKRDEIIKKGTLVIMTSGDVQLRLKILDKDTPHNSASDLECFDHIIKHFGI